MEFNFNKGVPDVEFPLEVDPGQRSMKDQYGGESSPPVPDPAFKFMLNPAKVVLSAVEPAIEFSAVESALEFCKMISFLFALSSSSSIKIQQ